MDLAGNAYVTGSRAVNGFGPSCPSGTCAFVAKFDPTGALIYGRHLSNGELGTSYGYAIAVDANGSAYVTGSTSAQFPITANAFQKNLAGLDDGFVTKLDAAGSIVYSTFLGGSQVDTPLAIAVDSASNAFVAGQTSSTDFPGLNGVQRSNAGKRDGFVAKLNAAGSDLVYSTLLGGAEDDFIRGIALDAAGKAYMTGGTYSSNFPTTPDALQASYGGGACASPPPSCPDAFVASLSVSETL